MGLGPLRLDLCPMYTVWVNSLDEPVGFAGIHHIDWFSHRAKIGIFLGARRGRGLGTEATTLLLDWGFTALCLQNVLLEAFEWNASALRIYERVGFREIGRRRRSVAAMGRRWDEVLMDVTAEDWAHRVGTIGTWTAPPSETRTTSSESPPAPPPPS